MSHSNTVEYTIQPDDSLFELARRFLSDGDRWHEITHPDGRPFSEAESEALQAGQVVLIPGESSDSGHDDFVNLVLEITNRERGQFGLPALSLDDRLNASALAHNRLMVDQGFFSHQGPGEPELRERVRDQGYNWSAVGENIAAGQATPEEATSVWFNETPPDDGHRRNILNPDFVNMGVGYIYREGTQFGHYWTVNFGRPE